MALTPTQKSQLLTMLDDIAVQRNVLLEVERSLQPYADHLDGDVDDAARPHILAMILAQKAKAKAATDTISVLLS